MAKILVDERTLELIPDFIQQVEKIVGEVLIVDSLAYGVKELLFEYQDFEYNEVVLARVNKSTNLTYKTGKMLVTGINSADHYLIHYE